MKRLTKKQRRSRTKKTRRHSKRRYPMKGGVLKFESISAGDEDRAVVTVLPDVEEAPITTSLKRARSLYE